MTKPADNDLTTCCECAAETRQAKTDQGLGLWLDRPNTWKRHTFPILILRISYVGMDARTEANLSRPTSCIVVPSHFKPLSGGWPSSTYILWIPTAYRHKQHRSRRASERHRSFTTCANRTCCQCPGRTASNRPLSNLRTHPTHSHQPTIADLAYTVVVQAMLLRLSRTVVVELEDVALIQSMAAILHLPAEHGLGWESHLDFHVKISRMRTTEVNL